MIVAASLLIVGFGHRSPPPLRGIVFALGPGSDVTGARTHPVAADSVVCGTGRIRAPTRQRHQPGHAGWPVILDSISGLLCSGGASLFKLVIGLGCSKSHTVIWFAVRRVQAAA